MTRLLHGACLAACATGSYVGAYAWAAPVEPPVLPTVHPTLAPVSSLDLPLQIRADKTVVWRAKGEQRMVLRGHVLLEMGYRVLRADEAVIWLTPAADAGDSAYDVAVYLSGNAQIEDGGPQIARQGPELLVTARIRRSVQLFGAVPETRLMDQDPLVMRGEAMRQELLHRAAPVPFIPTITIVDTETALQRGWIARAPGNRIIAGPGEIPLPSVTGPQVAADATGKPAAPAHVRPRPQVFATGDQVEYKTVDGEQVAVIRGSVYVLFNEQGKPPMELRAQRAVLFGKPAKNASGAAAGFAVTGVFLDGDVTLAEGNESPDAKKNGLMESRIMRAERLYYDFTSNRAVGLDAVLSAIDNAHGVPLYMRAAEIRQLARGYYAAKSVKISTSEFYLPHYHMGASTAYLKDITPRDASGLASGANIQEITAQDATLNIQGTPVFYWPFFKGDTTPNDFPLRKIEASVSKTYGPSIKTSWNLFGLAGQKDPKGIKSQLELDYFGKRGFGAGVNGQYHFDDVNGEFKSYGVMDHGQDRLGRDRTDVTPTDSFRGRIVERQQQKLSDNWTLALQGAYVSDVNFLEEYFNYEFESDSEPETSIYLKYQNNTEAFSILGKWSLFDFVASADQVDDQYTTEKSPEAKYYRIGDPIFDRLTYYSESGLANVSTHFSGATPQQSALQALFPQISPNESFRNYYKQLKWTGEHVARADTRHEIDMPLDIGPVRIAPYLTGRVTDWDQQFPSDNEGGQTTRAWGAAGLRANTQFWRVYDDVESQFLDLHRMRHLIEPEFNLFTAGSNIERGDLQPFDRDVEGISDASGAELALHQKWQTKRGGTGHWRNVDWLTLDVAADAFWSKPDASSTFFQGDPIRGFTMASRPELSQVQDSINAEATWRVGERTRILAEESYGVDNARLEQLAGGVAVDQSPNLTYFVGNRYIRELNTDEWTFATNYQLTRKYALMFSQSYDFAVSRNVSTTASLVRRMPRFYVAVSVAYDNNLGDTTFGFAAWPEGLPGLGIGGKRYQSIAPSPTNGD